MQFTTSDIQLAEKFALDLTAACGEMLEGIPVSRALLCHSVSVSTFSTLIRGLRKSKDNEHFTDDDIRSLRHPAWQDDLVSDICGDEYVYIPGDFEETLEDIEDRYLDLKEKEIIDSYYRGRKSVDEIAEQIGIDASNVRVKKNQALMKLRDHADDLVCGQDYLNHLDEMRRQYTRHGQELSWMKSAISFMKKMDADFDADIDSNEELSDEEKHFFIDHGVRKLSDMMHVDTSELMTEFVEGTEGYAAALAAELGSEQQVYPDTPLDEIGFSRRTLDAFHRQGLSTAGDVFALGEKEVRSLHDVGDKQIIHLCWQALHGIEKKGKTDGEEID